MEATPLSKQQEEPPHGFWTGQKSTNMRISMHFHQFSRNPANFPPFFSEKKVTTMSQGLPCQGCRGLRQNTAAIWWEMDLAKMYSLWNVGDFPLPAMECVYWSVNNMTCVNFCWFLLQLKMWHTEWMWKWGDIKGYHEIIIKFYRYTVHWEYILVSFKNASDRWMVSLTSFCPGWCSNGLALSSLGPRRPVKRKITTTFRYNLYLMQMHMWKTRLFTTKTTAKIYFFKWQVRKYFKTSTTASHDSISTFRDGNWMALGTWDIMRPQTK